MITVGGIKLKDLAELRTTWTRDGDKYTSPDGNVVLWIAAEGVRIAKGVSIGEGVNIAEWVSIRKEVSIVEGGQYREGLAKGD